MTDKNMYDSVSRYQKSDPDIYNRYIKELDSAKNLHGKYKGLAMATIYGSFLYKSSDVHNPKKHGKRLF